MTKETCCNTFLVVRDGHRREQNEVAAIIKNIFL